MGHFQLEYKDGKFNFDKTFENMDWDLEDFEKALERFASIQATPFKTELWKQYNEWKRKCTE
jgi:nuclear transport factor 2 (NTF2) superfamily protein